jgi:hypothetical protein
VDLHPLISVSSVVIVEKDIDVIVRTGHPKISMPNPSFMVGYGFKNNSAILFVPFELSKTSCKTILPILMHAINWAEHTWKPTSFVMPTCAMRW